MDQEVTRIYFEYVNIYSTMCMVQSGRSNPLRTIIFCDFLCKNLIKRIGGTLGVKTGTHDKNEGGSLIGTRASVARGGADVSANKEFLQAY